MSRIARHLNYGNVVASMALFLAIGGISWAAVTLPKNSVGTKQLKRNAVSRSKVRKNAITSAKVKNHSLRAVDFKRGQLPSEIAPQGPAGPPGPVTGDLPAGSTVRGAFNVDFVAAEAGEIQGASISFGLWLPQKPTVVVLAPEAPPTAACPGSLTNPAAAPGTLCVYENTSSNATELTVCNAACVGSTAERYGAELFLHATNPGRAYVDGSWAATAS
jgi:hypothetical protein